MQKSLGISLHASCLLALGPGHNHARPPQLPQIPPISPGSLYMCLTVEAATLPPTEAAAALRTRLPAPYFTLGQEPGAEDSLEQDYCSY